MFGFVLGFIIGGVTGAAIVLALSPSYQYTEDSTDGSGKATSSIKTRAEELGDRAKATVREAIEQGKIAAAKRAAELEKTVRRERGGAEESQA